MAVGLLIFGTSVCSNFVATQSVPESTVVPGAYPRPLSASSSSVGSFQPKICYRHIHRLKPPAITGALWSLSPDKRSYRRCGFAQKHLSGFATYRELAGGRQDTEFLFLEFARGFGQKGKVRLPMPGHFVYLSRLICQWHCSTVPPSLHFPICAVQFIMIQSGVACRRSTMVLNKNRSPSLLTAYVNTSWDEIFCLLRD